MFSIEDFKLKYEKYTDDELFHLYRNLNNYSAEAKEAFNIVISTRGGIENLIAQQNKKKIIADEVYRISDEAAKLGSGGNDVSFLKTIITSNILSKEKVSEIIDARFTEIKLEEEDRKIKPRTIYGSILGTAIASIIGGILWGLQMIYSHRIFVILLFGLILLCYGIIKLLTRQSKKNNVVLIATIIAVIISVALGQLLYQIVGYKG